MRPLFHINFPNTFLNKAQRSARKTNCGKGSAFRFVSVGIFATLFQSKISRNPFARNPSRVVIFEKVIEIHIQLMKQPGVFQIHYNHNPEFYGFENHELAVFAIPGQELNGVRLTIKQAPNKICILPTHLGGQLAGRFFVTRLQIDYS
jgi:hypothetical protein